MNCPVCEADYFMSRWCPRCLLSRRGHPEGVPDTIGWVGTKAFPLTAELIPTAAAECKRILTLSDWQRWKRITDDEPEDLTTPKELFLLALFADWLADNDCPIQEAAVRALLAG